MTTYRACDILLMMSTSIENQLRQAARKSGLSIKAMSDRASIPYAAMHRFITNDAGGITLKTAAKLAALLGLELRRKQRPAKGR